MAKRSDSKHKERSALDAAVRKAVSAEKMLRCFIDENRFFYERLQELQEEVTQATNLMKDAARQLAVTGQTLTLADTPEVYVSVVGKQESVQYDFSKASALWPPGVIDRVTKVTVESKKVEEMLAAGVLKDEIAEQAALPRKPMTPAVTVRFK